MRSGDHLDHGGDPIGLDPGDDPGEPVARRLGDDRSVGGRPPALVEEPADLIDVDQALAAVGPFHAEPALGLPAAKGLDRDAEHLGGLADPEAGRDVRGRLCHTAEYHAFRRQMSRCSWTCEQERPGTTYLSRRSRRTRSRTSRQTMRECSVAARRRRRVGCGHGYLTRSLRRFVGACWRRLSPRRVRRGCRRPTRIARHPAAQWPARALSRRADCSIAWRTGLVESPTVRVVADPSRRDRRR